MPTENLQKTIVPPVANSTVPLSSEIQENRKSSTLGPTVGIVIIMFILLLGGLYFWGKRINNQKTSIEPIFIPATQG